MSEAPKKKFRLIDAIMTVICVVFVAEAASPVAAIGNSQYFWWIFLLIAFLLPYGLISSELGTTYEGDGGLYDWVSKAFGKKMGRKGVLVLLDQLSALDGFFGAYVPRGH
uniref:amino acid permease n=1 Tax=Clostridium sp. NkU-1 TaxID=1095009 RepID=UPI000B10D8AB